MVVHLNVILLCVDDKYLELSKSLRCIIIIRCISGVICSGPLCSGPRWWRAKYLDEELGDRIVWSKWGENCLQAGLQLYKIDNRLWCGMQFNPALERGDWVDPLGWMGDPVVVLFLQLEGSHCGRGGSASVQKEADGMATPRLDWLLQATASSLHQVMPHLVVGFTWLMSCCLVGTEDSESSRK